MKQPGLFPEIETPPPVQEPLRDPVERMLSIIRDTPREKAVLVKTQLGDEHWVPRSLIRFASDQGGGEGFQLVRIEKQKAKELDI
jgi:hypothetical protein